ncbi:uncharacterized protein [Typha latifolia]|uniref:uncharacterized protein isoform X2 n=1 Tax=Typha latifolia TaxID=4733 RepID=UPI003C2ADA6E
MLCRRMHFLLSEIFLRLMASVVYIGGLAQLSPVLFLPGSYSLLLWKQSKRLRLKWLIPLICPSLCRLLLLMALQACQHLSARSLYLFLSMCQKLMVQGYSGHAKYNGGLDVVRKILKAEGIRGLYRGFGLSVMTYSPSSAVWWASYGSSQRIIWRLLGHSRDSEDVPSQWKIVGVQATGGVIAGAVASCITTPIDTIKTRLQVMDNQKRQTAREVVQRLIAEDGWKGLYRGLGPRFFSMSAWGTTMIVAYEYMKRLCAKSEEL